MGLLYTTEGTRRVLNTLNTAFDGPGKGLDYIRSSAPPGSKLRKLIEKRSWKPARLARMLQLLPFDQGNSTGPPGKLRDRDTRRWHWFLKNVLGASAAFPPIRNALADAILNQDSSGTPLNLVRVSFDHVELTGKDNPNVVIFDAPLPGLSGGNVRHITLFTVPVPEIQDGTPFDPNDPDEPDPIVKPPWDKG
jgi:hypothetical protein